MTALPPPMLVTLVSPSGTVVRTSAAVAEKLRQRGYTDAS